jgi:hypothetical protein
MTLINHYNNYGCKQRFKTSEGCSAQRTDMKVIAGSWYSPVIIIIIMKTVSEKELYRLVPALC